jgi:multiple sugar transport system substrate-binding protein
MITLRGITWDHPRGYAPLAASVDTYADLTGVRVTWDARSLKDFGDAPLDALADAYDLLIIDHPHVGMAAESGCLHPLDSCLDAATLATLAEQSAGPSHASYTYAGHQWGLAIDTAMQTSAYRPDLFDGSLPQTWDAALALGQRVRRSGRFVAMPLAPTDCICSFMSLCASLGDPLGDNFVSAAIARAALRWLADFAAVAHPGSLDWNPILMLDHMSAADDVVYCPLTFCYTNYARAGYAASLVRFADIPGVNGSLLGGAGYAVSARCAYPAEACAYGAWLCGADVQHGLYVESGGQPGNRVAWTDDHANAITHEFFRDTWATLQNAYVRPRHAGFVTFQEASGVIIHDFLRGKGDVDTTADRLRALYLDHQPPK